MVDDKLLDGSRGGARIPLITTVDVLDLYAARMAIGEVVLRSLALRPQRYLVPVQLLCGRSKRRRRRAAASTSKMPTSISSRSWLVLRVCGNRRVPSNL